MCHSEELYSKAYDIVREVFAGDVDKNDEPYLRHLMTVAEKVGHYGYLTKTVALLHDLVEMKPDWPIERIEREFGEKIAWSVYYLTRVEGQTYDDYIAKLMDDQIAVIVKIADLEHNMDLTRWKRPLDDKILSLVKRYHKNYLILKPFLQKNFE